MQGILLSIIKQIMEDLQIKDFEMIALPMTKQLATAESILTQGARTILLHGMRMWPAMITTMFWPFALKAMAERLNSLHASIKIKTGRLQNHNYTTFGQNLFQ